MVIYILIIFIFYFPLFFLIWIASGLFSLLMCQKVNMGCAYYLFLFSGLYLINFSLFQGPRSDR